MSDVRNTVGDASDRQRLSRRDFLTVAGIGAAAAATATVTPVQKAYARAHVAENADEPGAITSESLGVTEFGENGTEPIEPVGKPGQWDFEADVVVVGGGGAGLAAAATAAEAGASVIVLEKRPFTGGDTSIAIVMEGFIPSKFMKSLGLWGDQLDDEHLVEKRMTGQSAMFAYGVADPDNPEVGVPVLAIGPSLEVDYAGIQDSFNNIYTPTPQAARDASLVRRVFERQGEVVDWLMESCGMQFSAKAAAGLPLPGLCHVPIDPDNPEADWEGLDPHNAQMFTDAMRKRAEELGVSILLSSPASALVRDDSGRVVGVSAQSERYGSINVGGKAIILTTGGFADNPEMLKKYAPLDRVESVRCWSMPGAKGDGIRMAQGVGARTHMMGEIEMWDGGAMREYGSHGVYTSANQLVRQKSLTINKKGRRFFSEGQYRGYYYGYQVAQTIAQPGHESATILDSQTIDKEHIIKKFGPWFCEYPCKWFDHDMEKLLADGSIIQADTIEELAEKLEYPVDEVVATVKRYNQLCKEGYDADFFKEAQYMVALENPPYYAVKQIGGSCFETWGGVVTDDDWRVLDDNLDPIPGLYAAGENVAGGASVAFVVPGGRLAAEKAVANEVNKEGR